MLKVLFVCVHNSARSQMAEAFFNQYAPEGDIAESAGIKPGALNPFLPRQAVFFHYANIPAFKERFSSLIFL